MIVSAPTTGPGLAPVERALAGLRRRRGAAATSGLAPGLVVPAGSPGWTPASALLTGGFLHDLLVAAKQRWNANPPAAAALAWRSYTYWLVMPVVLGWATARRVPLLAPDDVLVRVTAARGRPLLTIGLRRLRLAVRADDPLARTADPTGPRAPARAPDPGALDPGALAHGAADPAGGPDLTGAADPASGPDLTGGPDLTVVASDEQLLGVLRSTLRDGHLDPLLARFQGQVNLGTRTLLGSLASAVAYGAVRGIGAPPADVTAIAGTLLSALGVADLVALESGPDGPTVRRRTCCLAFTLPEPKICSGCCLRSPL